MPARKQTTKPPAVSRAIRTTVDDHVRIKLRAGFDSLADCRRELLATDPDELFDEGTVERKTLRAEIERALKHETAAVQRDARSWPRTTDCDRLDAAFDDLEEQYSVLARQDYWCCQTCGIAAISDEIEQTGKRKRPPAIGYVFFHNQDTESAVRGEGLYLAYGGAAGSDQSARAVGRLVVDVLRDHELKPRWGGDVATRIELPVKWRRRLPKTSVVRP